jgi:xanthine dehydrogenase molybdopterin-binding subunit B
VVTIDDAIRVNSFYPTPDHHVTVNDAAGAIAAATSDPNVVTVTGELGVGGQEHFYLECMSTLCVPMEGGTLMDVFSSTQAPAKTQVRIQSLRSQLTLCKSPF